MNIEYLYKYEAMVKEAVFDGEGNVLEDWHVTDDVDVGSRCRVFYE